jgi:hypothetical protein
MNPKSVDRFETELAGAAAAVVAKMGRKKLPPLPSGPARHFLTSAATATLLLCATAYAQHLSWDLEGQKDATCLYGEITVLATAPQIYYCGANWHPGEPAGGYCGIQHNSETERRTIFSVWDTSPQLLPKVTAADPRTVSERFGGEGTGAHTHMLWPWKSGDTFQFFVDKVPGKTQDTTDTRYYIYDRAHEKWIHSATITNPNGGKRSVATLGGGLNSFLENFSGQHRDLPKLALYRLWLGSSVETLKCLTKAGGDGTWGQLYDAYFLAEGSDAALNGVLIELKKKHGQAVMGTEGRQLEPIADAPLDEKVITALKKLRQADEVGKK